MSPSSAIKVKDKAPNFTQQVQMRGKCVVNTLGVTLWTVRTQRWGRGTEREWAEEQNTKK